MSQELLNQLQASYFCASKEFQELLKNPKTTFEDVILSDEFFQELKSSNKDLIN